MLWECPHEAVVKQRKQLHRGLEKLLEKGGLDMPGLVVAMSMWRLEEDGAGLKWEGWDEVPSPAEMMEGMDPEAAEALCTLERAMPTLDGTALDLARKGPIGADYKQLLVMLGMTKTGAGKAAQGVQKLLSSANGIGGMWKAFSGDLQRENWEVPMYSPKA